MRKFTHVLCVQYQQSGSFVEYCYNVNKSSTLRAEGKQWSFKASTRSSS